MPGIEEFELPKTIMNHLVKASLPENVSVQKDARTAISKASTVFINYVASTANDLARKSGHKTIMPQDIFQALKILEFDDFIPHLQAEFQEYKRLSKLKKESARAPRSGPEHPATSHNMLPSDLAHGDEEDVDNNEVDEADVEEEEVVEVEVEVGSRANERALQGHDSVELLDDSDHSKRRRVDPVSAQSPSNGDTPPSL